MDKEGTYFYSGFSIVNLIFIFFLILFLVLLFLFFFSHRDTIIKFGIAFNIQEGILSGTSDKMRTGGNNLYIVNSSDPLTLTLSSSPNHTKGRIIKIKNKTKNNTTLIGEPGGITLDPGELNLIVTPGQTATFIAIDDSQTYLRLE